MDNKDYGNIMLTFHLLLFQVFLLHPSFYLLHFHLRAFPKSTSTFRFRICPDRVFFFDHSMVQVWSLVMALEIVGLDGDVFPICASGMWHAIVLHDAVHVVGCAFGNCNMVEV